MTTPAHIPLDCVASLRPGEHPAGSLLAIPRRSKERREPCWAIRFDLTGDAGREPWMLFLNEPPFGPRGSASKCRDFHGDDDAVLGTLAEATERTVEIDPNGWISGSQIAPDQAAGFVAIGNFGLRLIGWFDRRYDHQQVYVDTNNWTATADESIARTVTAYATTWQLRVRFPKWESSFAIPFNPNPSSAQQ